MRMVSRLTQAIGYNGYHMLGQHESKDMDQYMVDLELKISMEKRSKQDTFTDDAR